ncbi:MAG: hypothetical protein U0R50_16655 [Gaiellales bacterium]
MADLYIRWSNASPKDVGVRPLNPCWPPNAFWTNASIWMSYPPSHPDPTKRNQTALTVALGEEVLINVAVFSKGADFVYPALDGGPAIRCQVWACTGANGVGPVSALPSSGGANGITGLVLGFAGPPDFYGVASVPWRPDAADGLAFDANGAAHVCLAANLVYNVPAGSTPAAQGQYLPQFVPGGPQVTTIFPCGDGPIDPRSAVPIGHFQGQKNVQVLATAAPAQLRRELEGQSTGAGDGKHTLELVERTGKGALPALLREQLLAHAAVALAGGRPRKQRMLRVTPLLRDLLEPRLGAEVLEAGELPAEAAERAMLAGGGRLVLAERPKLALGAAREPLEGVVIEGAKRDGAVAVLPVGRKRPTKYVVDLSAAADDPPGTVRAFDLAERSAEGTLIGGTTFVTLATLR